MAAPASPTPTSLSAVSSSSVPPASARPNWREPLPSSSSTTRTPWCASTCRSIRNGIRFRASIGAPPGYVGYEEGGQLTEAVRRRPYSVVLLDEIEKAHPDVWNILLQVLDDGRLTDSQGRTVDFKNTILIMTSNLGSDLINARAEALEHGGHEYELVQRDVLELLRRSIRPEFLNRIDEIIVFKPLGREQLRAIVDIQIRRIARRLDAQDIRLNITDRAKDVILRTGYDPVFGARPMKRALQHLLLDPLSEELLSGRIVPGQTVTVEADGERLTLIPVAVSEPD